MPVIDAGLKLAVTPVGRLLAAKATAELNPSAATTLVVTVPLVPAGILSSPLGVPVAGRTKTAKDGTGAGAEGWYSQRLFMSPAIALPPKSHKFPWLSVQVAGPDRVPGELLAAGVPWVPYVPPTGPGLSLEGLPPIHVHSFADGPNSQTSSHPVGYKPPAPGNSQKFPPLSVQAPVSEKSCGRLPAAAIPSVPAEPSITRKVTPPQVSFQFAAHNGAELVPPIQDHLLVAGLNFQTSFSGL